MVELTQMVDEKAFLSDLIEVFPSQGSVVPYVEMKFRLAPKYSPEGMESMLTQLIEKGILTKFEFNNTIHYKAKEEIPVSLGATASSGNNSGSAPSGQMKDLEKIIFAIGTAMNNDNVADLINEYQKNYSE